MKKILQLLLLSSFLIGCSSIDYSELTSPRSPSDTQIERILALNLSYENSIKEANKLMDEALVSTVVKNLEARKLKTDNDILRAVSIAKSSENVIVSNNNMSFKGSTISDSKVRGLLGESDSLNYFVEGSKDKKTGLTQHQINMTIEYTSTSRRNYSSASVCDKWQGCKDAKKLEINLPSSTASNCTSTSCVYTEIMELSLSDNFLRDIMEDDFSVSFNAKKITSKINFTSDYLKGYLAVVN